MTRARDEWVERVRAAADIVEVIGETVPLKRVGKDMTGCCPFHEDKTPSLSVTPAKGLWHCHACNIGGDVFEFVMRRDNLKFPGALDLLSRRAGILVPERLDHDAERVEHVYQDTVGNPIARKVRHVRGGMTVKKRGGGKEIWWEYRHDGAWYSPSRLPPGAPHEPPQVLYRLPEVLAAVGEGRPVYVCEGEKCADAVASLGLTATCNPAGASNGKPKWLPDHAEQLRGASSVLVLADDDDQGVTHAEETARTTCAAGVPDVRVIRFTGQRRPDGTTGGGDVADWIRERRRAGASDAELRAELEQRVGMATHWQPAPPADADKAQQREPAAVVEKAAKQGQALELEYPEPAAEPVDGPQLFADIVLTIRRYVLIPSDAYVTTALWIALTYLTDVVDVLPRLLLTSPTKACGKSRLLAVLGALVKGPLPSSNVSPSVIFRVIQLVHPTLLLDEMDNARLNENDDLRSILNSGHERANAWTLRNVGVGDNYEPRRFSTWAAMAFAAIGRLPDTVTSRCVCIPMRRMARGKRVQRVKVRRLQDELGTLRRGLARWCSDNTQAIGVAEPQLPDALDGRAADNWSVLVAIADAIGGDWGALARSAALQLSGEADDDGSATQLFADLRQLFRERQTDRLSSKQICSHLSKLEGRPWPEWKKGMPLTQRGLAVLLKPFDVEPRTVKLPDGSTAKGYHLEELETVWGPYIPQDPSPPSPAASIAGETDFSHPSPPVPVTDGKGASEPRQSQAVTQVTESSPKTGPNGMTEPTRPCRSCGGEVLYWGSVPVCRDCHRRGEQPLDVDAIEPDAATTGKFLEGDEP